MKENLTFVIIGIFFMYSGSLCLAQALKNKGFEQECPREGDELCPWAISWGSATSIRLHGEKGNRSLHLKNPPDAVSFVEQEVPLPANTGIRLLKVSARIRTTEVTQKGSGLNITVYDTTGQMIFSRAMGSYSGRGWVRNTRDWENYTLSAVLPGESHRVKVGALLYGEGQAWFDDFEIQLLPIAEREASPMATAYIDSALSIIATHALYQDSVDLKLLREQALAIAGPAKNYEDAHLAVRFLLQALGDGHSFLMEPQELESWKGNDPSQVVTIEFPSYRTESNFGYILVPPFHGGDPHLMQAYIDSMQMAIQYLSQREVKGWIVDLRQNTGGNMGPMITGLGPLFRGNDTLGYLIDLLGRREAWRYKNGTYYWNDEKVLEASSPVTLSKHLPIAVLMGHSTGSSGECTLISFIDNPGTRTFGQASWGLTTGNGEFLLPDGAQMMLASTRMANRKGKVYYGTILPEVKIEKSKEDVVMERAIRWLQSQY